MSGLDSLPKDKWSDVGKQPVLKSDLVDIEAAILQGWELRDPPRLVWVDATRVQVQATADSPANILMAGFPNIMNPGSLVRAGLTDGKYRQNTADVYMDFDTATTFWGTEKVSQWYVVYGIAGDSDTDFTLKAMPLMRVSSQAVKTITLRNNLNAANIGYGFTTDELLDAKIYLLSGSSKGLIRTITANNNDNGIGGTITYTGDALAVSQGDWFIVLPNTNFRWIGSFFNSSGGNILEFVRRGHQTWWLEDVSVTPSNGLTEWVPMGCPLAVEWFIKGCGDAYITHPDWSGSNAVVHSPASGYVQCWTPCLDFCKFTSSTSGWSCYSLGYGYPSGCGY
jgi:hypothetical protein